MGRVRTGAAVERRVVGRAGVGTAALLALVAGASAALWTVPGARAQSTRVAVRPTDPPNPAQDATGRPVASIPSAPAVAMDTPVQFGRSHKGAPLLAYVFGGEGDTTLVLGGVHGDERSTPGVVERLRAELRRNPSAWEGSRVVLVPRMNPDGLQARTRTNGRGVDLNRNLPCGWRRRARGVRYRPGPCPASEPETQALIALIARYQPGKVISIHQPFHYLDYTGSRGRQLAALMGRRNGYRSVNGNKRVLPGCLGGYCGSRLGLAMVTLELPRISADAAWRQNRAALLEAIRWRMP